MLFLSQRLSAKWPPLLLKMGVLFIFFGLGLISANASPLKDPALRHMEWIKAHSSHIEAPSDERLSSSHWLMRFAGFDILVVQASPSNDKTSKAQLASIERGGGALGINTPLELGSSNLSDPDRIRLQQGGKFIVFTPHLDWMADPLEKTKMLTAVVPFSEDNLKALRSNLPVAKQMMLLSLLVSGLVCLLPFLCLWIHSTLRKKTNPLPPALRMGRASAAFLLCIIQLSLAISYELFAAKHFPGPRLDLIAMMPYCIYSLIASLDFLTIWAKGEQL